LLPGTGLARGGVSGVMCELLAMCSRHPARLTFSLETLAAHSGRTGRNRDGWGAAFYRDNDVALFREPVAASDSPLVRFLETQGPPTTLAISHIRRATRGAVTLSNTQPFLRELAGRAHVFAHNGDLPGLECAANLALGRYRPVGTTDSEHAFCALLERMHAPWSSSSPPPREERWSIVAQFAAELRELGPANFLYADGESLFAHGHRRIQPASGKIEPPGLYRLSRRCVDGDESIHADGVSVGPGYQEVLLIASAPLTDEDWRPFAEGELVAVSAGRALG
jgi:glutamine amidotransferase